MGASIFASCKLFRGNIPFQAPLEGWCNVGALIPAVKGTLLLLDLKVKADVHHWVFGAGNLAAVAAGYGASEFAEECGVEEAATGGVTVEMPCGALVELVYQELVKFVGVLLVVTGEVGGCLPRGKEEVEGTEALVFFFVAELSKSICESTAETVRFLALARAMPIPKEVGR